MKKGVKIAIGICLGVAASIAGGGFWYSQGAVTVNSARIDDVSQLAGVKDMLIEDVRSGKHRIFADMKLDERFVSYDFDMGELENISEVGFRVQKLLHKTYLMEYNYEIDYDELRAYVEQYNEQFAAVTKDACLVSDGKQYVVEPEVYGDQIDYDSLCQSIKNGDKLLILTEFVAKPQILSSDLTEAAAGLNQYINWTVSYDNGEVLQASIDDVGYDENYEPVLDTSFIDTWYHGVIEKQYNTYGHPWTFMSNSGEKVTINGGTWGTEIDNEKELTYLKKKFKKHKSVTGRTPEYTRYCEPFRDNYVEVSIGDQHVWVYKDGICIMDADCVTGKMNGHGTPKGGYYITERVNGKYLVGVGYRTWVDKWMRLTDTGIGLHDAKWRNTFGGKIYINSGSHGCVNLPKDFAYELYDITYIGMPVVIY